MRYRLVARVMDFCVMDEELVASLHRSFVTAGQEVVSDEQVMPLVVGFLDDVLSVKTHQQTCLVVERGGDRGVYVAVLLEDECASSLVSGDMS